MQRTRLLALTMATAGLTLAGCKIQPIDNNEAPMSWRAMPQTEAYSTAVGPCAPPTE